MCANDRSISEINGKIQAGTALVHTEMELRNLMESGQNLMALGIDVITMAFHSSIARTAAMLLVPVTGRGVFTRAEKISLNGVPGYPGPAPNERLGVVDTLVFADQVCDVAGDNHRAAKLFSDLLNNVEIGVECLSVEGDTYKSSFSMKSLQFARMVTYNTSIPLSRIHNGGDAHGTNEHLRTIRVGSKVLLNKAPGIVIGCGTRGPATTLSLSADMFDMDPKCLEEISGESGPPMAQSVALTVPVLNEAVLEGVTSYLRGMQIGSRNACFDESDEKVAIYLKDLVLKKEFMLNDSDVQSLCA